MKTPKFTSEPTNKVGLADHSLAVQTLKPLVGLSGALPDFKVNAACISLAKH